jgi:hypothetical protein
MEKAKHKGNAAVSQKHEAPLAVRKEKKLGEV